jgi:hypothetical protein
MHVMEPFYFTLVDDSFYRLNFNLIYFVWQQLNVPLIELKLTFVNTLIQVYLNDSL